MTTTRPFWLIITVALLRCTGKLLILTAKALWFALQSIFKVVSIFSTIFLCLFAAFMLGASDSPSAHRQGFESDGEVKSRMRNEEEAEAFGAIAGAAIGTVASSLKKR